jgi:hypothetical protein
VELDGRLVTVGQSLVSTSGELQLELRSAYELTVSTPTFRFVFSNSDRFINQQLQPAVPLSSLDAHGLLGQTHRRQLYKSTLRYIEGDVDDYAIADNALVGKQYTYNKFSQEEK